MRWIKCTAERAPEFKSVIDEWPEVDSLVAQLRDQGMFPGLRAMRVGIDECKLPPEEPLTGKLLALKERAQAERRGEMRNATADETGVADVGSEQAVQISAA